jgi:hypothetical protein
MMMMSISLFAHKAVNDLLGRRVIKDINRTLPSLRLSGDPLR